MNAQLAQAHQSREDRLLDEFFDRHFDLLFSEADTVGPDARHKLRGILKHYAKNPHPFRACVKDNMKRFGPGRTERVCAVLKDIIRGTTHWRHGEDGVAASAPPEITPEVETLLLSIPDAKLEAFLFSAQGEVARCR